jgi:hypothetical protein
MHIIYQIAVAFTHGRAPQVLELVHEPVELSAAAEHRRGRGAAAAAVASTRASNTLIICCSRWRGTSSDRRGARQLRQRQREPLHQGARPRRMTSAPSALARRGACCRAAATSSTSGASRPASRLALLLPHAPGLDAQRHRRAQSRHRA